MRKKKKILAQIVTTTKAPITWEKKKKKENINIARDIQARLVVVYRRFQDLRSFYISIMIIFIILRDNKWTNKLQVQGYAKYDSVVELDQDLSSFLHFFFLSFLTMILSYIPSKRKKEKKIVAKKNFYSYHNKI